DRDRQRVDARLVRVLAANGYAGPRFELAAAELAAYALPLVLAALYAGRLPGPSSTRLSAAEGEEAAHLAVARALARVRTEGLPTERRRPGRPTRRAGLKAGFLRWVEREARAVLRRPDGVDPEQRALFRGFGVWESSQADPFADERLQTAGRD